MFAYSQDSTVKSEESCCDKDRVNQESGEEWDVYSVQAHNAPRWMQRTGVYTSNDIADYARIADRVSFAQGAVADTTIEFLGELPFLVPQSRLPRPARSAIFIFLSPRAHLKPHTQPLASTTAHTVFFPIRVRLYPIRCSPTESFWSARSPASITLFCLRLYVVDAGVDVETSLDQCRIALIRYWRSVCCKALLPSEIWKMVKRGVTSNN